LKKIKPITAFFFAGLMLVGVYASIFANAATSTLTVFSDGFESGNLNSWSSTTKSYGETITASTYAALNGRYGGRFTTNANEVTENSYVSKNVDLSEIYAGGDYNIYMGLSLKDNSDRFSLIQLYGGSQTLVYASIKHVGGVDRWSLYIRDGSNGFWTNAASSPPQVKKWYHVELHWRMGSASSGVAELYVDGVKIIEVSGVNTSSYGCVKRVDTGIVNAVGVQNRLCVYVDDFTVTNVISTLVKETGNLNISIAGSGSTNPAVGEHTYSLGETVALTATPKLGYIFTGWSGGLTGSANPVSVTINGNMAVTATFTYSTPPAMFYIVSVSGSTYTVKNPSGGTIYSGSSASAAIQAAVNSAVSGDTIQINSGVYVIHSMININNDYGSSGLTIQGGSNTTLVSTSDLKNYLWNVQGKHITTQYINFNDNYTDIISPVIQVTGSYDTVTRCGLRNVGIDCYGLECYEGDHFTFTYNTIHHVKYGIATGGAAGYLVTDGLIAYNNITCYTDAGIKLRWAENVTVTNNYCIDGLPSGLTPNGSICGVAFFTLDGPCINDTVYNNVITYSGGVSESIFGIISFSDVGAYWLSSTSLRSGGNRIYGNSISYVTYGLYLQSTNLGGTSYVWGNTFMNCGTNIYSTGSAGFSYSKG
jgi:hypothetical protein